MYTMHKIPTLSPDNHCTVHILDMYTIYVHKIPTHSPDIHCKVHIYMYTMYKIPTLSTDIHCTAHTLNMYKICAHHVQDPNPFSRYPMYSTYIKHVHNCVHHIQDPNPFSRYLLNSTYIKHVKNMCTQCIRYQPFLQISTVQYTYIKHVQCTQYVYTMFMIPTLSPDIHCTDTYIKHVHNMCTPCTRSQPFLQTATVQYIYLTSTQYMYTMYKIPTLSPNSHCTVHILNKYTIYVHHVQDPNPFYGYLLYSIYIKPVTNICTPCTRSQPFLQIATVHYTYI